MAVPSPLRNHSSVGRSGNGSHDDSRDSVVNEPHELTVVTEVMVLTVSQLSRWLVHSKPPEIDSEAFIIATGRMLRALLPVHAAKSKPARALGEG